MSDLSLDTRSDTDHSFQKHAEKCLTNQIPLRPVTTLQKTAKGALRGEGCVAKDHLSQNGFLFKGWSTEPFEQSVTLDKVTRRAVPSDHMPTAKALTPPTMAETQYFKIAFKLDSRRIAVLKRIVSIVTPTTAHGLQQFTSYRGLASTFCRETLQVDWDLPLFDKVNDFVVVLGRSSHHLFLRIRSLQAFLRPRTVENSKPFSFRYSIPLGPDSRLDPNALSDTRSEMHPRRRVGFDPRLNISIANYISLSLIEFVQG